MKQISMKRISARIIFGLGLIAAIGISPAFGLGLIAAAGVSRALMTFVLNTLSQGGY